MPTPPPRRVLLSLAIAAMVALPAACASDPQPLPREAPSASAAEDGRVVVPPGNEALEIIIDQEAVPGAEDANAPDMPVFQSAVGQGEGTPVFVALINGVALHQAPLATSAIVGSLDDPPGREITYSALRQHTLDPGLVRAEVERTLRGRDLGQVNFLSRRAYYDDGAPSIEVPVTAGMTVEYLMDRAEGSCFLRIDGHIIEAAECPSPPDFTRALEPATERWILVSRPDGSPVGWARVASGELEEIDRIIEG